MKSQILPEENLIIIRMGQASLCNNCGCRAVDESKFVSHDIIETPPQDMKRFLL